MKRLDVFRAILQGASAYVPGGIEVKDGIEKLINRDADPSNDIDEVADALAAVVVGALKAAEALSEKDLVNDAALKELAVAVKNAVKQAQLVLVKPVV